jgi:predicted RecB family nuclease
MKKSADPLMEIPGIGPALARELHSIGITEVRDLVDRDPHDLYLQLCEKQERTVDRCVLYVFRCAVYFATVSPHDPELLKWWNWKEA